MEGDDGVPDMAIGRLPVLTAEELGVYTEKVIAFENAVGDWTGRLMMLADDPDPRAGDFAADSDDLAAMPPVEYTLEKIYLSELGPEEAHRRVLDGINAGAAFLNYFGHSGLDRLAGGKLLASDDVGSLNNGEMLPVMSLMGCMTGRFEFPGQDSPAESLLMKGDGGAVAVWASSGLSLNSDAKLLAEEFYREVFIEREKILGRAVTKALAAYVSQSADPYLFAVYNLLGDPALKMNPDYALQVPEESNFYELLHS